MNKSKLKSYAPQARKDFIASVTTRANQLGLSEHNGHLEIAPAVKSGDVVIIAGQLWPVKVQGQREQLIKRIHKMATRKRWKPLLTVKQRTNFSTL